MEGERGRGGGERPRRYNPPSCSLFMGHRSTLVVVILLFQAHPLPGGREGHPIDTALFVNEPQEQRVKPSGPERRGLRHAWAPGSSRYHRLAQVDPWVSTPPPSPACIGRSHASTRFSPTGGHRGQPGASAGSREGERREPETIRPPYFISRVHVHELLHPPASTRKTSHRRREKPLSLPAAVQASLLNRKPAWVSVRVCGSGSVQSPAQ